jgi:hypothetical protein
MHPAYAAVLAAQVSNVSRFAAVLAVFASSFLLTACAGADNPEPAPVTSTTGALCPASSTLTYDNFAGDFFASYCIRCHSTANTTTESRQGATPHYNWDDPDIVRQHIPEIDSVAAGGPKTINTVMPPSDPVPSDAERLKLGEWLACGAP